MQIKYEGLWRLDFIDLQTFRTHIQDITCLNQIINYRGYTFLNMQPEFRLTHISHEVILRSIDGQFGWMMFGDKDYSYIKYWPKALTSKAFFTLGWLYTSWVYIVTKAPIMNPIVKSRDIRITFLILFMALKFLVFYFFFLYTNIIIIYYICK